MSEVIAMSELRAMSKLKLEVVLRIPPTKYCLVTITPVLSSWLQPERLREGDNQVTEGECRMMGQTRNVEKRIHQP